MGNITNNELEQQIIEVAKQLFTEKGFVETNMCEIAARVGINRPTLHYYFRTKERMFQAVFSSIVMSLMPKVQEIARLRLPFLESAGMVLDEYVTLFTQHPDIPQFICREAQRDIEHLIAAAREAQYDTILQCIRDALLVDMEAGRLRKVPMHTIFLTFYSLLAFPLLSKNIIIQLFLKDESEFPALMQEWKEYIMFHLRNLLLPEK